MAQNVSIAERATREVGRFDPVADASFFLRKQEKLLRDYSGRFVAIRNEEVVADAEDYFTLYWRLCEMYGEPVSAYIRQVCPDAFVSVETEPTHLFLQVGQSEPH